MSIRNFGDDKSGDMEPLRSDLSLLSHCGYNKCKKNGKYNDEDLGEIIGYILYSG